MQFHTWPFLVFFVIVYLGYLALRPTRFWIHWLLVASYVFYGWWNPLYLLLIAYSTALDYYCVRLMQRSSRRGVWLAVSLVNNLALLGFFKYAGWVTDNLNALLAGLGSSYALQAPDVLLPVGISFFTFQSMSYTIDYYRGNLEPERNFVRFAAFVSFFPQLVAGPIERASSLLPQMRTPPPITRVHFADGLSLFLAGLMKKVALADYLAGYADPIFANPAGQSASSLACATVAFAWQIYFDFSGYTDMARGVARVMGFDLMLNFNHPYLATGMRDFWSRWHMSLSTWFRDYVYIPLGGNRLGRWSTYRNLFLTMVISGLWHGAAWTYVVWGVLHGAAYVLLRPLEDSAWYRQRVPVWVKRIFMFCFVCLTWIFFRAASLSDALLIVQRIVTGAWTDPALPWLAVGLVATVFAYQWIVSTARRETALAPPLRVACYVAVILYLSFAPGHIDQPFIYFQF
jgi:alginate O-acetyltransferase complex protein AlgI